MVCTQVCLSPKTMQLTMHRNTSSRTDITHAHTHPNLHMYNIRMYRHRHMETLCNPLHISGVFMLLKYFLFSELKIPFTAIMLNRRKETQSVRYYISQDEILSI